MVWNDQVVELLRQWAAIYGVATARYDWHWSRKVAYYLRGIRDA